VKRVVLDTTVASFLIQETLEFRLYEAAIGSNEVEIAFQTVAEILDGAEKRGFGGKKRRALLAFLGRMTVVPYSFDLAQGYARVRNLSRRQGRELLVADAWIAATAIHRKAQLLTHDTDFRGLKVPGLHVVCLA
jgi:predicted nucleic acid-binding protein